jgi:hypothetical protein
MVFNEICTMKEFKLDNYPKFYTILKQKYRETGKLYVETFAEYGFKSLIYHENINGTGWVWLMDDAEFTWFVLQWS